MGRLGWVPQKSGHLSLSPGTAVQPPTSPLELAVTGSSKGGPREARTCRRGIALVAGSGFGALTFLAHQRSKQCRRVRTRQLATDVGLNATQRVDAGRSHILDDTKVSSSVDACQYEGKRAPDETTKLCEGSTRNFRQNCSGSYQECDLNVHFLYASPLVRPGSDSERLPALSWEAEVGALKEALQLRTDRDDLPPCQTRQAAEERECCRLARLEVSCATVDVLAQLATGTSSSSKVRSWWHIAAHTEPGTGKLVLEDDDGSPHATLSALSTPCFKPPLGAVILACDGEKAGQAILSSGIPFAIVSRGPLRDVTAHRFTLHFYRRLLLELPSRSSEAPLTSLLQTTEGHAVRKSFELARQALQNGNCPTMRGEADRLVLLHASEGSRMLRSRSLQVSWMPVAMSEIRKDEGQDQNFHEGEAFEPGVRKAYTGLSSGSEFCPLGTSKFNSSLKDCEDFVGRGAKLIQLLKLLGATGGRRVVVLHGPSATGKSALGSELCNFATAPGRRFSPVGSKKRMNYVSLRDVGSASTDIGVSCSVAHLRLRVAVDALAVTNPLDSLVQRTCLVIDHAETQHGWRDEFIKELLDCHPQLCLLLLRRQPLYRIDCEGGDRWKPVNVELGALTTEEAARLFLRRLHRPLFNADFDRAAAGSTQPSSQAVSPLPLNESLIRKLAAIPAFEACAGMPRNIVSLASEVTWELPSLLDLKA